jgi:hypothetical protein
MREPNIGLWEIRLWRQKTAFERESILKGEKE